MKGYTTIEQSKKLLSLGLDPSTADMIYTMVNGQKTPFIRMEGETIDECRGDIPAWSLTALFELMPVCFKMEHDSIGYWVSFGVHCTKDYDEPIDAAFEMVCWLIEQGHIKVNK